MTGMPILRVLALLTLFCAVSTTVVRADEPQPAPAQRRMLHRLPLSPPPPLQ